MASQPTFAYWDLRGLAEPIRFLLHYIGVEFVDKRYTFDNRDEWVNDKFNLGLDFPNLPYYIDGDLKITQSLAILRYLAQKHHLEGDTPKQKIAALMVEQQLIDFRFCLFMQITKDDADATREDYRKKAKEHLKLLERFLGSTKFLTGDTITYADFLAYETLDFHRLYDATILDDFPTVKEYHQRIINLPELQEYLHSSTYKRWPIFGPMAKFGYNGDEPAHA